MALMAYTGMKMPLSQANYETIAWLCKNTGSTVTPRYQDHHFFKDYLHSMNTVMWEDQVRFFKSQQQIGLFIDIADSYLLIRISGLDSNYKLKSMFWQAREMATKSAQTIYKAILHAFTQKPKGVSDEFTITEEEFFEKLSFLNADGASENGVRRAGKGVEFAVPGKNVLHYLQERRHQLFPNGRKILGWWCVNHMLDIISARPEKDIAWIAVILTVLRSIIGHISGSSRAQGLLKWLHDMIEEHGADGHSKGLASAHYAPHRWISSAQPLKKLCEHIFDLVVYLQTLSYENRKTLSGYGEDMLKIVMDIKFVIVLPGLLDILSIMDTFNKSVQPRGTTAGKNADQISLVKNNCMILC